MLTPWQQLGKVGGGGDARAPGKPFLRSDIWDFPGGAVVKSLPVSQCRGHGFDPWSGKIPHAAEQLSPSATTTEPAL